MKKLAYNVHEAALMLGISAEQVKVLVRSGKLRAVRSAPLEAKPSGAMRGGKLLISEDSMREWLDGLEVA